MMTTMMYHDAAGDVVAAAD